MSKRPLIGVAVIVTKDDRVLLGKRKNSHGADTWAFPGGHLEFNESIADCAAREVFEETGLKNLCLAGGVALNSVANGRIIRETPFEEVFIQPAAGDAGGG